MPLIFLQFTFEPSDTGQRQCSPAAQPKVHYGFESIVLSSTYSSVLPTTQSSCIDPQDIPTIMQFAVEKLASSLAGHDSRSDDEFVESQNVLGSN